MKKLLSFIPGVIATLLLFALPVTALAAEAQAETPGYTVTMYFSYGQYSLGTVHAERDFTGSSFDAAKVWIK